MLAVLAKSVVVSKNYVVLAEIVKHFEKQARFEDEAELIREKLEQFVTNILAIVEVEIRDKRF